MESGGKEHDENLNMEKERRFILEQIVFAYLVGEREWNPINARAKVEKMTDEELEKFVD